MITVTYKDDTYECATALRGDNYIHLLDESNALIVIFEGIVDFSCFSIENGDWTYASDPDECLVAVIHTDGKVTAGSHKCKDITPTKTTSIVLTPHTAEWATADDGFYVKHITIDGITADTLVMLKPDNVWAYNWLVVEQDDNTLIFKTVELPSANCTIQIYYTII